MIVVHCTCSQMQYLSLLVASLFHKIGYDRLIINKCKCKCKCTFTLICRISVKCKCKLHLLVFSKKSQTCPDLPFEKNIKVNIFNFMLSVQPVSVHNYFQNIVRAVLKYCTSSLELYLRDHFITNHKMITL